MKQHPKAFYQAEIDRYSVEVQHLNKKLVFSSILRLLIFLGLCTGIYFVFGNTQLVIAILVVGIAAFVFSVNRHNKLKYQRDLKKALYFQNVNELEISNRNFSFLYDDGISFKDDNHPFSQDIDLFGDGSFYEYCNRTSLPGGAQFLAALLTDNDTQDIEKKQKAIQELSKQAVWRQHFTAVASLVNTETPATQVVQWLKEYTPFAPRWIKGVAEAFTVASVLLGVFYFFEIVSGYVLFGWFLLGLVISGKYLKKVNKLSEHTSKIQGTFEQFYKLISEIETKEFASALLSEKKNLVVNSDVKASGILKKFAKNLDALDQRNNMLVGVLLNGFMLRDIRLAFTIEAWIDQHKLQVENWFHTITFFDAYNSLANYAFNHPKHTFPKLKNEGVILKIQGGAHPLLDPDFVVPNDFEIASQQFFIVTGANMAGKSTFLRTVSLHIVMANVGLPVCATSATYNPIKLITSMRTSDSLTNDESYFFSELKRLQFIVERIKSDRYFIILDEILKGTNSTDKAIGSRKFIEKLVSADVTGIIATHDLSLCEVAKELAQVKNYYFDAQIINDELYFDYTFKPGICQNMNASFLLKKMNIVD